MYAQIDGILAWGDLISVSCAELRSPCVPLWGPNPHYVARLGPCVPELGPSRPIFGGQVGHNWHKKAVRRPSTGHFGPPAGRFCTLRGSIFGQLFLSENITKAVLWAKLAQAYAQHRFTSLCNFYMWISTATDSRSIDR